MIDITDKIIKCFICDGQGFFIVAPENYGGWYECPECHGKGWLTEQEVEENKAKWLDSSLGKLIEKRRKTDVQDYLTIKY